MPNGDSDGQLKALEDRYRALLAVSEAIASCRDLPPLFHALAGQLGQVAHYDALSLVLHDAATNMMRLHVLETSESAARGIEIALRPDDDPAGLVWQTQQPLVTSNASELQRWPEFVRRVERYGVQSCCWLPLTTARRRLGALVFTSKRMAAYDGSDLPFLQLVASQVAVAVENALAFREIEALKDKLAEEKRIWRRRFAPSTNSGTSSVRTRRCAAFSRRWRQSLPRIPPSLFAGKPAPARN